MPANLDRQQPQQIVGILLRDREGLPALRESPLQSRLWLVLPAVARRGPRDSRGMTFPAPVTGLGRTTFDGLERPDFLGLDVLHK